MEQKVATTTQHMIAKELTIKLIDGNYLMNFDAGQKSVSEYHAELGKQVGILYQSILDEVSKTPEY